MRLVPALVVLCALAAGCGDRPQKPLPPAPDAPKTTQDSSFKSNPNVPDYLKRQAGGGGATGPRQ